MPGYRDYLDYGSAWPVARSANRAVRIGDPERQPPLGTTTPLHPNEVRLTSEPTS
jgi:hypothetical protein